RNRSCILLWMSGGPSQLDTFDLKPSHKNGGPFKPHAPRGTRLKNNQDPPENRGPLENPGTLPTPSNTEGGHAPALLPAPPAPPPPGADPLPVPGRPGVQGAGQRAVGPAQLRQHRPLPHPRAGRLRVGVPRPAPRPPGRRRDGGRPGSGQPRPGPPG